MRRFVLLTGEGDKETNNAISTYFRAHPTFGFWHWLVGAWILVTKEERDAVSVRDEIHEHFPQLLFLVLAADLPTDGQEWSSFAPTEWNRWLNIYWARKPAEEE